MFGAPPKPVIRPLVAVELLPLASICSVAPTNMSQAYCPATCASARFERRLPSEPTGNTSAWLETHPAPDTFTCDGSWHQGTWRITDDPLDPSYGPFDYGFGGPLIPGAVYVQFCWDDDSGNNAWHAYSEQFAHAGY